MSKVKCPKCEAMHARRLKQEGFFQTVVLQRFGYYPWQCKLCKAEFVLRNRGQRSIGKKRVGTRDESTNQPASDQIAAD